MIQTIQELKTFSENFAEDCFAYDCETTSLNISKAQLVCITLSNDNFGEVIRFKFTGSYYIQKQDPANKRKRLKIEVPYRQNDGIDIKEAQPYLAKIFRGKKVVGANLKYDTKLAMKFGFFTYILHGDTQVQSYILDVNAPQGLKYNVKTHLGIDMISYAEASDSAEIKIGDEKILNVIWETVDWKKYFAYALRDAETTWQLWKYFMVLLQAEPGLLSCYENVEMPLVEVTAQMEFEGVTVDVKYLQKAGERITQNIAKHEAEVYRLAGVKFNIGSSQQLADILFNRLGYKSTSQTKSGAQSTDEETIKFLAYQGFPIADELLRYKKLVKLQSTYIEAIPELVHADGRLRCNFNQTFTKTGRFCVHGDTEILTDKGRIKIETICPEKEGFNEISTLKTLGHDGYMHRITHGINKGTEEMYEIRLQNGFKIKCTLGHKFFTDFGWKSLKDILSLQTEYSNLKIKIYEDSEI